MGRHGSFKVHSKGNLVHTLYDKCKNKQTPLNGLLNRNVIENSNRFDGEINVYSAIQCCKSN